MRGREDNKEKPMPKVHKTQILDHQIWTKDEKQYIHPEAKGKGFTEDLQNKTTNNNPF